MLKPHQFKLWETKILGKLESWAQGKKRHWVQGARTLSKSSKASFSVFVERPQSNDLKVFRVTYLTVFFLITLGAVLAGTTVYFATGIRPQRQLLVEKEERLASAQTQMEQVREEIFQLKILTRNLEQTFPCSERETSDRSDVQRLARVRQVLSGSTQPLSEIGVALASQNDLMSELPMAHPLNQRKGIVTAPFGPAIHVFTGQWYLHKGIDIAQSSGTPIVATADGMITKVDYEAFGYGNYVEVTHKYGFLTKYAHMARSFVKYRQSVVQGQVIGAVGSSGLSTGPHIHYEIRLGGQVIDPGKYLTFNPIPRKPNETDI